MKFENRHKFLELADDMHKHPEKYGNESELYNTVIHNLDHGKYDDFDDRSFDAPKMKMVDDFRALGREDIAEQVMNGDFDQ